MIPKCLKEHFVLVDTNHIEGTEHSVEALVFIINSSNELNWLSFTRISEAWLKAKVFHQLSVSRVLELSTSV